MGILNKLKRRIKQKRETRLALSCNNIQIPYKSSRVSLHISGKNNTVIIKNKKIKTGKIDIQIYGDNNSVIIDSDVYVSDKLRIIIGNPNSNFAPAYNCEFSIGANTTIESMEYCTFNSGAKCNIGAFCMFSYGITIFNTDGHPIFDLKSHEIINYVKNVSIGEHVWVGAYAKILKNTVIPDDSIIGYGSVVAGKFTVPHTSIAGNPACVVRENISWDSFAYEYCQNNTIKSPVVVSAIETVAKLVKDKKSICRFGDGEFDIMFSRASLSFQKYDDRLCKKLWETWNSNDKNIMVAVNASYFRVITDYKSIFLHKYLNRRRHKIQEISDTNKTYYDSELSCVYKMGKIANCGQYYNKVRSIWKNRDIVLVHGSGIFDKLKYNIFDNAKSIESVIVPSCDAFDEYDTILQKLLSMGKNKIYILICGPTATVLAHDLAVQGGVQALDFGHIAKDYDWFKQGIETSTSAATQEFFSPD